MKVAGEGGRGCLLWQTRLQIKAKHRNKVLRQAVGEEGDKGSGIKGSGGMG